MEKTQSGGRVVLLFVGAMAAALLLCSSEPAQAGFLNSCTYCHGMPPRDGVRKANPHYDSMSSSISGNHQTHLGVTATAADCTVCHTAVDPTNFAHQNEIIEFQSNIHSSPATGQYRVNGSAIAFKNQTSVPLPGSCSNVNCHFESQTPVWGSASLAAPAGCATCHGAPPQGGATGTAGSHAKHDAYYSGTASCAKCHSNHAAEAKPFAHATTAGRPLNIQLEGSGTYSGIRTNYLPSQSASQVFGSCGNLYCHSSGQSATGLAPGTTVTTPLWGAAAALTCGSCHVNMDSSASATGSHVKHAQTAAIACAACHNGSTETGVSTATHVNKNIDLGFSGIAPGTVYAKGTGYAAGSGAYSTCSASYCHSTVQSATGVAAAVTQTTTNWGSGPIGCGSCHVDMSTSASATGSHIRHAQASGYSISCAICHGTGYSAATVVYPSHVNKLIDLNMAGTTYNKGNGSTVVPASGAYGTCSASTCHTNGTTPAWGSGPLPVDCSGCHGIKRSSMTASTLSGRHDRHLNYSTNSALGLGNSFNCLDCHAKTVSSNTVVSDRSMHVNGMADYSGVRAGRAYNSTTKACSTLYCHSNGNPRALVFNNMTGSKSWNGSASLGCNGCHGKSNPLGTPDYPNGGAATATPNSHAGHVAAAGITDTTGCTNCHAKTADAVIANKFKDYSASKYHLNGSRDISFRASAGGAAGSFNSSAATCATTYCHGTVSPQWGSPAIACNSCHSASNILPGAHQIHVATADIASSYTDMSGNISTSGSYRFSCAACHKGQHAGGPAHANGVAEVFFSFTSATMKGSYTYGGAQGAPVDSSTFKWSTGGAGCNTTYCHSNGNGSNGAAAVAWTTTASTVPSCAACHGDAASLTTGAHAKHVSISTGKGLGCVECHARSVSSNSVISDKTKHVNKFKDYSGLRAGGSASYSQATTSCSASYCHSNGKGVKVAPVWTNASTGACGTCHGATSPVIATAGHAVHTAAAYGPLLTGTAVTLCASCHTYTTESAATHVNGTVDVNSAGNCTNQCHRNASPVSGWTGATRFACESCHDGNVSYDARFSNISAPRKTMATFTAKGHGKYNAYICTTCHSNTSSHIDGLRNSTARLGAVYEANQNGLCSSCHTAGVIVPAPLQNMLTHVTFRGGATGTSLCSTCHDTHGTGNYSSIRSSITFNPLSTAVTISHTTTLTGFIDPVTNRGLCQVCHTATNHFRRDKAEALAGNGWLGTGANHSPFTAATNCLSCHTHKGGSFAFYPTVSDCNGCHGYPPVPRNTAVVINRQNNYSSARFADYSGGGGAHVINNHVPKTAKATDGWSANCSKCHNQADHVFAPVEFKPSKGIKVTINQRYKMEPAKQARYTSNRLDGNLHVPGNCSNISCHFGATPAWNQR